jgi:NAD(P)-dependent dehydrogenase (short-subunit alcohol dehydrogenase family)
MGKGYKMAQLNYSTALIVGAGDGLSASIARRFAKAGLKLGLVARNKEKLTALAAQLGGEAFGCDATQPDAVADLFNEVETRLGTPDVVIYNAAFRVRGPITELNPRAVEEALKVCGYGGFLVAQQAARRMLAHRHGAIFFTGASASVKGYAQSAPFAMGKFALHGLAQSLARELGPQGIHVAHFIIDGPISPPGAPEIAHHSETMLDPDAIAETYFDILSQQKSAWSFSVELRPWGEKF